MQGFVPLATVPRHINVRIVAMKCKIMDIERHNLEAHLSSNCRAVFLLDNCSTIVGFGTTGICRAIVEQFSCSTTARQMISCSGNPLMRCAPCSSLGHAILVDNCPTELLFDKMSAPPPHACSGHAKLYSNMLGVYVCYAVVVGLTVRLRD